MSKVLKVWHVLSGPYHRDHVEEAPDDFSLEYMMLCKYEVDSVVKDQEFWFETFDEAYTWVTHFQTKIEPIEIPMRYV